MSAQPRLPRTRSARLVALAAAWGAVGSLVAIHLWMQDGGAATGASLAARLAHIVPFYLVWAALTPAVVRVSRAIHARGWPWPRSLAAHAGAAVLAALAHIALYTPWSVALASLPETPPVGVLVAGAIARRGLGHLATYAAVVAAWHAWRLSRRARERELAAAELAARLADARLAALRAQINPHFLFNALNGVAMLVRRSRGDEAVNALTALGDLLRRALDDRRPGLIPLAEDLALCERYLAIEHIRFGERLRVEIRADADVADVAVPVFLLQPLVENAVRHGVSRRAGPATIRVSARRSGAWIVLRVWNDGPPLDAGDAEDDAPGDGGGGDRSGVGLRNTRARLESVYGDRATLALRDEDDGVAATITLPGDSPAPSRLARPSSRSSAPIAHGGRS